MALLVACHYFQGHAALFVSMSATLIALFKDKLTEYFFPAILEIIVNDSTECFQEISIPVVQDAPNIQEAWLGAIVRNTGTGTAKNVELFFDGVKSNVVQDIHSFKSLPLVRSWIRDQKIASLPPGLGFRFDICFLRSNEPRMIRFALMKIPIALSGITCEADKDSKIKFTLKAISENSRLVSKTFQIKFNGKYTDGFRIA